MDLSKYYMYQSIARGLKTPADVVKISEIYFDVYDRLLRDWIPANREAHIFEVACGPGIFLLWLKANGYQWAVGSDSSDVQIGLAKGNGLEVKLIDAIADLRSYSDASLDCVVALDFYEHLPKELLLDFLSESFRVLRSGGRLILRGPNGDSPVVGRALYNDITHFWALTSVAFDAILKMSGFSHVDFRDDTIASIVKQRWVRVPLARLGQTLLRALIRVSTRENIKYLSSSFFICASK
jgi:SAM-dependent methyltransferase